LKAKRRLEFEQTDQLSWTLGHQPEHRGITAINLWRERGRQLSDDLNTGRSARITRPRMLPCGISVLQCGTALFKDDKAGDNAEAKAKGIAEELHHLVWSQADLHFVSKAI